MRFNLDAPTRGGLMSAVGILLIVQVSLSVEVSSPEQTKPQEQISSKPESSVNINLGQSEGTSPVSSSSLLIESSIESFPQVQTKLTNVVEKTSIAENLSSSSPSSSTTSGTSSISSSSTSSGTSDKKEVSSEGSVTSSESLTVTSDGTIAPKDVSEEKLEKRDEQTETTDVSASSADTLQDKPSASSSPVISTSVSASLGSSSASVSATPSLQSTTTSQTSEDPIPTRFPEDDLLGLSVEYEPINDALKKIDPRMGTPQSVYKVVPTASLQAIEMTTATYHNINPNRVGLIDETNHEDHFLVNRASHNSNKGGPLNPATRSSDDDIRRSNNDDISKRPRNNDRGDSVPAINDILSGLLSVVGEGLNFATNYVQENNKRKQEQQQQQQLQPQQNEIPLQINNNNKLFPSRNRTRVNNRGPPRLSEIPFEAIPLEVQSLGGKPIQIQRPFGLPGGLRPPNFGQERPQGPPPRRPPPSNSLFPKRPDASPAPPLPTRPDYEPGFLRPESEENKDDDILPDKEDDLLSLEELYQFKGDQKNNAESLGNSAPDLGNTVPDRGNTVPDRGNILQNDIRRPTAPPTRTPSSTPPPPTQLASSPGPEIQSSFGASPPPFLVTPPATQKKRRPFNRRQPPRPDGRPNRPPRPDGRPVNRPQTSVATPPLNSRPQVLATRPTGVPNVVTGIAVPADSNIVTGIAIPAENEIFDITVTAQQGFGSRPTKQKYKNFDGIITKARPGDQFVSIDGKRTYFDLGATNTAARPAVKPTRPVVGRGGVIGATLKIGGENVLPAGRPNYKPYTPVGAAVQQLDFREAGSTTRRATTTQPNPGPTRRPLAPPVRIDTCIVGDNTTCKDNATEVCRTYLGVSSCYCKPGFGRKSHRLMCKRTVKLLLSLKLDRIQDTPLSWSREYRDPNSEKFQVLEGEASYAIDSAMALTSFSNLYMGNSISTFYPLNKAVTVNTTMEMIENGYTTSQIVKRDLEQKLVQVIQARGNNIGNGNLYVAGLFNPIPDIRDFNECAEPLSNDCGDNSVCINTFGGFTCECKQGYGDRFSADERRSGRECTSCPQEYCSNRGVCSFLQGEQVCTCEGNYYGDKCEVDGEVLAVAIGASVAAVVIIILTLVCLCMWSRRWKREQEKVEMSRGYNRPYIVGTLPPPPSYTLPPASSYHPAKVPGWGPQPSPAYPPRWTNHVDAQQNIYAPEPGARRVVNPGGRSTLRGPLPSLPRPSTALGTRGGSTLLLESESDDTENSGRLPRPRSSMMAGNLNAEDDFESEYLRYGGTVGVRNPRLVAAMRGVPPYQQHIQMNMINRF